MSTKIQGAQRDFSFGEVDVTLKRADDHPARKAGLRQMVNARILNSGAIQDRPGRSALFPMTNHCTRTDEFTIAPGANFKLAFGPSRLQVINSSGTVVANFPLRANGSSFLWDTSTVNLIRFAVLSLSVYITFPGQVPQVLTWDGVSTWTIADFAEIVTSGGQKRTPFYRISPQNVTMQPSAVSGNITVKFSSPIVVSGMAGTRVRYAGRQILLGSVVDSSNMNATVIESLPVAETITFSSSSGKFYIGDVIIGATSGANAIVTASPNTQYISATGAGLFHIGDTLTGGTSGATGVVVAINNPAATTFSVSLNTGTAFVASETITGPGGSRTTSSVTGTTLTAQLLATNSTAPSFAVNETVVGPAAQGVVSVVSTTTPQAISVWDDEVMNSFRGYPGSVFVDNFRLGFCNFPSVPGGILWSAINSPTDMYTGAAPSSSFFEVAPSKAQVYDVVPGPESSEFVFCDRAVYYIPVSPTNPLEPGHVQFQILSGDGAANVRPRIAQEAILYANAGQNSIIAIIATGAYQRPFNTKNLSEFHAHLFNGIKAIAAPSADGTFNERYAYVMNGDGSIVVGKYDAQSLMGNQPVIGWGPWTGVGTVQWVSAFAANVLFTTSYYGASICEILDDTVYLDCALPVNAAPAPFAPPPGHGPLWFIGSQTVWLMDQTTRAMGVYNIDSIGFIIPQGNAGENLSAASLVAGQGWTMTAEPFVADANPGADAHQRMFPRRVARFAAYVNQSTGFMLARLFSGRITPTSPALGTIMNFRRFPAWYQGDDPTKPPPLRETTERIRPLGRAFDPRVALIKDTPGPLQLLEMGVEVTI